MLTVLIVDVVKGVIVAVVTEEVDAVVTVVVAGVLTIYAITVVKCVGAVLLSVKQKIQKCATVLTVFYIRYVPVERAQ